ncbi:hypothetical protein SprV_0501962500 [Sparganum proliferum]
MKKTESPLAKPKGRPAGHKRLKSLTPTAKRIQRSPTANAHPVREWASSDIFGRNAPTSRQHQPLLPRSTLVPPLLQTPRRPHPSLVTTLPMLRRPQSPAPSSLPRHASIPETSSTSTTTSPTLTTDETTSKVPSTTIFNIITLHQQQWGLHLDLSSL